MLRKSLICCAVAGLVAVPSPQTMAQGRVGEWNVYSIYDGNITDLVDTRDKVYFVSSRRLYSFDKETEEMYSYTTRNKLSDTNVALVRYNAASGYLLIAYVNGNIDLLHDDGRLVNLSDITDAELSHDKSVNDVAFSGNRIYVATGFGLVIFDDKKNQVVESGLYGIPFSRITVAGDNIVAFIPLQNVKPEYSGRTVISPVTERHNSIEKFRPFTIGSSVGLEGLDNGSFITDLQDNGLWLIKPAADNSDITERTPLGVVTAQPLAKAKDGTFTAITASHAVRLGNAGNIVSRTALPTELRGQRLSFCNDLSSLWGADRDGIANYSIDGTSLTVVRDKAVPQNVSSVNEVGFLASSQDGSRIYVSNIGHTRIRKGIGSDNGPDVGQLTDVIADGVLSDAAIFEASADKADSRRFQSLHGSTRMYGGPERLVVDPDNPNRYYIANFIEGVYVVENNEEIAKFNSSNMPTYCYWGSQNEPGAVSFDVSFDPEGNLWVGSWIFDDNRYRTYSPYVMLPKEKLRDPASVTLSDWQPSAHLGQVKGNKDMASVFSTRANVMFTFDSEYETPISVINAGSSFSDTSDDRYYSLAGVRDQDGNAVTPSYWICAREDRNGRIWFGSSQGIYEIANPATVLNPNFTFTRLKVPRNDGTNYADYLLESEQINDIAVDASNRKWIATQNSGLYLVSENGDAILENFNMDNSPLPSNMVTTVLCDPLSNLVYVGTPYGLLSYNSTSAPPSQDYSDVYAYPNPVKPDYSGPITIKGLMDNSLVKIADAAGNVFYQTRSDGGMAVWNGCNANGERVRSGVYFVYASQNENGSSSGAVAKILVVN